MEQFITVGMDAETIERVGTLPEGKGLLGALIDDPSGEFASAVPAQQSVSPR